MGPETTQEGVSVELMAAVSCIRRAIVGISGKEPEQQITDSNDVICELSKITGALERCMETQKLRNGRMKCTTCGATSVGLLNDDCHTSTTTTTPQRNSEEPHRKISEDEEEECSSVGSHRIASVDSTSSTVDAFEHPIRSVSSSVSAPADEEDTTILATPTNDTEADLVMQTILKSSSTPQSDEASVANNDATLLDQFLQTSLLGLAPETAVKTELEENDEDREQNNTLLSSFFQVLFAGQQQQQQAQTNGNENTHGDVANVTDGSLDSLAMIESLLAESATTSSTNSENSKAGRKRKSTPMKVPKTENGAGYVCPMEGCNKVFKEKGSVHRHFVTHIGMRFNCDKCKASYTQKHALMLHQKIHSNPDAYQCRGCGTNYTTQNGLRLHRQRNPTCMELTNALDFNSSLNKNGTPTKQMVSAP